MSDALIVIPTYLAAPSDLQVLIDTLESLRLTEQDADVLLVDDCSPISALADEAEAAGARLGCRTHRKDQNEGFSRAVNVGIREALDTGRDAVLVNADISFIDPGWLQRMQNQRTEDGDSLASVVGGLLLYPNGLIQHGGIFFSMLHRTFGHRYQYAPQDLPEAQNAFTCPVTGALQFIRHDCLLDVGIYDEDFRMGFEDVDYCIRAFMAGRSCVYQPRVRATHYESLFRGRAAPGSKLETWQNESWWTFMKKYATTNFGAYVPSIV